MVFRHICTRCGAEWLDDDRNPKPNSHCGKKERVVPVEAPEHMETDVEMVRRIEGRTKRAFEAGDSQTTGRMWRF